MNSETKVKQRPILFSTPMVQAIMEGTKTVTRRTLKIQPEPPRAIYNEDEAIPILQENGGDLLLRFNWKTERHGQVYQDGSFFDGRFKCPYGNVGDVLWIRETWTKNPFFGEIPKMPKYLYKATDTPMEEGLKWKPSIHMPFDACRLYLQITNIKVERLQDITEEQAVAEGLACLSKDGGITYKYGLPDADGLPGNDDSGWHWSEWEVNPIEAFKKLWEKINGAGSWNANPWVWAISFKRIDKPV